MSDDRELARRWRPPASNALLILLASVVGCVAVLSTVAAVILWARVGNAVQQIQAERRTNIARACRDQNGRHDRTVRELDRLIAQLPVDQRARARRVRDANVALIDALAPHQDCAALVDAGARELP